MSPVVQQMLGLAAGVVSLAGFVPYLLEIVRGDTKPNRATWWIWTVVGVMLTSSYYAAGARYSIWVPVSYLIGPLLTALLSLPYGEGGSSPFDRACLAASAGSVLLWVLARSPLAALAANMTIDLLGALPTVRKAYSAPASESLVSWIIFLAADVLNLGAVGQWSFASAAYPLYLTILAIVIVALLARPWGGHRLAARRNLPGTPQA